MKQLLILDVGKEVLYMEKENEVISTNNVEEIPREEIPTIPQIQNVVIDKKTKEVKSISRWADGRKIDPAEYPNNIVLYIEGGENFLDMNKRYKYENEKFLELPDVIVDGTNELEKQILELQNIIIEEKYNNLMGGVK